jgi:hypothetical protein
MIVCQNCLREHPDDTPYCDACGEPLTSRPARQRRTGRPAPYVAPGPDAADHPLVTPSQVTSGDMQPAPASMPPEPLDAQGGRAEQLVLGSLRVRLNSGKTFELSGRSQYLIGRRDDERGIRPDLDLTAFGGLEGGVSRAHAIIHARPDGFFVEDLGSTNETLLNFFRLLPHQLYPLHDGDQVRFGALTALVIIT